MATTVSFNGTSYSVPAYGDSGWAQGTGNLSSYLVAIAAGTLQTTGGTFTLSAPLDFGSVYGITGKSFTGNLIGNVTGNCSGSSGSCTGNSATATTAAACSGNATTATTATTAAACSGNAATATTAASCSGNSATVTTNANLTGEVTSVGNATTVVSVDGSSASNIHSAELAANAATNANTASTIVKRDGSGDFSAGTITASLTGTASVATVANGLKTATTTVAVSSATAPISGQALIATGATGAAWGNIGTPVSVVTDIAHWQTTPRAINTVYQNTTGKNLYLSTSLYGDQAIGICATSNFIDFTTAAQGQQNTSGKLCSLFVVIPPSYYYQVTATGGTQIIVWTESY